MAYKNIVFVKLEKRLLNDHRWYTMSDHAQLLYIKLILLAAETYNKIPKSEVVLIQALRSELETGNLKGALQEIKTNFPMFKSNKHFYYFGEFEHKTNFIPNKELLSNRSAIAKHTVEEEKNKKKNKKKNQQSLSDEDFINSLKTNPVYKGIDIDRELGKMDAWLSIHKGRQKTRKFIVNWLNKIDKPVDIETTVKYVPPDPDCRACNGSGKLQTGEGKIIKCACVKEVK